MLSENTAAGAVVAREARVVAVGACAHDDGAFAGGGRRGPAPVKRVLNIRGGVGGGILEWMAMVGLVGVGDAAIDAAASAVPMALPNA